ncbi:hypothetical protein ABZZ47_42630 [Streptomyces sp. NPDC006465]|uniref:hypothetical protein n=1 Tax=Streptomyces sp. NPDC006465 TaxID=3157174 RepID=UPI0033BC4A15
MTWDTTAGRRRKSQAAEKSAERARVVTLQPGGGDRSRARQQFVERLARSKSLPDEARLFAQRVLLELPKRTTAATS